MTLCLSQSATPAGSLYPSNLARGKPGASGKAAANFTLMHSLAEGRWPPKLSLNTRRASGPLIHLLQLTVPSGVWAVEGSESAKGTGHQDSMSERKGVAQPQVFHSNFPACLAVRK